MYFTVQEILDQNECFVGLCIWEEFCAMKEINVWAVKMGLLDFDEEFELTDNEIEKLGLIKEWNE